jgi:hypothetical protein
MREIKQLTSAERGRSATPDPKQGTRSRYGARSPLFAAGLAVAVLAGAAFGGLYVYSQRLQTHWQLDQLVQEAVSNLNKLPASELLDIWDTMSSEEGLPDWEEAETTKYNKQGRILEKIAYGLGAVALIGLLGALLSFLKN